MTTNGSFISITPLARRVAEEQGIDIRTVQGSGHAGKIFTYDLKNIREAIAPKQETGAPTAFHFFPEAGVEEYEKRVPETKAIPEPFGSFHFFPETPAPAAEAYIQPHVTQEPLEPLDMPSFTQEPPEPVYEPAVIPEPMAPVDKPPLFKFEEEAADSGYIAPVADKKPPLFVYMEEPEAIARPADEQAYEAPLPVPPEEDVLAEEAHHREAPPKEEPPKEEPPKKEPTFRFYDPTKAPPEPKKPAPVLRFVEKAPEAETQTTGAMVAAAIAADNDVAGVMRMNDARRSVAAHTARSALQTAAVTQHMETDVTELALMRTSINAERDKSEHIPLMAFYVKAMAICVREKDRFRMRLADAEDAYLLIEGAHVGFQIACGEGISAPVIRNADVKSVEDIAAEIASLTEKAKRGSLTKRDVKGSSISLIDKGESAIHAFTPIISLPESAILGIGAPYQRLVMTERSIENRQFIMQSLTFDHRVINGHEADEFQRRLKDIIEDPQSLVG